MAKISDPQIYKDYMEFVERIKKERPEVYQQLLDDTIGVDDAKELADYIRKVFQTTEE